MTEQERWTIKVVIDRDGEEPLTTWQHSIKSNPAELHKLVDNIALRTFNHTVCNLIKDNPFCGSDVAIVDDSSIPKQERPQHRSNSNDLMNAINYHVYNPPSMFEEIPHIQKAARIYDSLPEVYQEAVQKMCKSLESIATTEHDMEEFGLWQSYLNGMR